MLRLLVISFFILLSCEEKISSNTSYRILSEENLQIENFAMEDIQSDLEHFESVNNYLQLD